MDTLDVGLPVDREKHPNLHTFSRLVGFLRPYRWSLIVSIVLAAGSQAASIGLVRITQSVIDDAIRPQDERMLWIFVAVIATIGLVKALLMVGRRFISGRQALGVEFDMRNALYAHLLRLSFGFYDRHQTGQLMSRATVDLQAVRFFLGYGLIFFFQHVLTIVGVTAIMFWTNWRLALVALAITPVIVALAYRYSKVSHPILRDVQQKMADVATVAEENIVGVHVVKSFAQEAQEQEKFQRRSDAVFQQSVLANRQRSIYVPTLSFVPLLAQAAVLLVGGWMVVHGSLSVGEFFAFNLYVTMLIMPLRMLGMWIGQSQRATASGERIFQILDEPEEIAEREGAVELPPGPGRIEFDAVSFGYDPERLVLSGVDLAIAPDQNVAVIGHTGSGKTTLTALVPRFYDATEGRVLIDGIDVRDVTLASLRSQIAVISQDPFLFSTTVRDDERRPAQHRAAQADADQRLGRGVDGCGGVVEDEDPRVDRERPRNREPLPLAAGERDPALADHRLVALRQPLDELVRLRGARDRLDRLLRQVAGAERDVLPHRRREEERIL